MKALHSFYDEGISPSMVLLEVTEQSYVKDETLFYENLSTARELGHPIVVDDFGTGYSNFNHVRKLQPNIIKIDGQLIQAATENEYSLNFLKSMVSFIRQLGSRIVLEGVETKAHADVAELCRADFMQGYYFGLPEPVSEIESEVLHFPPSDIAHSLAANG